MSVKSIVSMDTDRIKEYVFATNRLKEITGASALLDYLNRVRVGEIVKQCTDDAEIYIAHGGQIMAAVPTDKAETIIRAIQEAYREYTLAATITGVHQAYSEGDFPTQFRDLTIDLQMAKVGRQGCAAVTTAPFVQFCQSCGAYPAASYDEHDGQRICEVCKRKRHNEHKDRLWKDFMDFVEQQDDHSAVQRPDDLGVVGQYSAPSNYVGYIYCDGNRMGKILNTFQTPEAVGKYARGVDEMIKKIAHAALYSQVKRKITDGIFPGEIIMLGGDDVIIVTTADTALPVAIEICRNFQEQSVPLLAHKPISMSAGVVLAHAHYPIFLLQELAEELIKQAKMKSFEIYREQQGEEVSTIDFMVVTDATSDSPNEVRQKPPYAYADGRYVLTERPYTVEELAVLWNYVRDLKCMNLPRNRLEYMYQGLFDRQPINAQFRAVSVLGRLRNKALKTKLKEFFGQREELPWIKNDEDDYTTQLLDLVELYRFVPGGAPKGSD